MGREDKLGPWLRGGRIDRRRIMSGVTMNSHSSSPEEGVSTSLLARGSKSARLLDGDGDGRSNCTDGLLRLSPVAGVDEAGGG